MEIPQEIWALELGANVSHEGVRFRVWAPRVPSASLRVEGGSGEISMHIGEKGYFTTFINGLGPGTRYFYLLDGNLRRPDPVSRFQPDGVHGPSEVIDPCAFPWEDHFWKGIPPEEMILYEIHAGTFTPEGTFEAIIPFLDYLKYELGVTAIELMPVGQFPGGRNWGYDGTYLYAPQNSYGGPRGLKTLVNECHQKGLAILLDVVYNHLGPEGNYLGDYGPYFTDRYKSPWGTAINFDGPESDEVRRLVIDNALYWVTEYHMDGLRIDAIHGIFDFSARHILDELREAVQRQAKKLGRRIVLTAESDLNDARVIHSAKKGGYGLDAQWNDDFHHSLHTLLTKERSGYYQDFGDPNQLAKALREGFIYSGQYSSYRKKRHGSPSKHLPPAKFIVFSQNHDQVGNRIRGERLSTLVSFEALKLAAGIVLLSPNIPLLFMGEEYSEEAPFQYFISHSNPDLVEAVRRGRREEFDSFQWKGEPPDPQSEETFLRCKLNHKLRQEGRHRLLFEFYRELILLRKTLFPLAFLSKEDLEVLGLEKEKVLWVRRWRGVEEVFLVFNLGDSRISVNLPVPAGDWRKQFDSEDEKWDGRGSLVPDPLHSEGQFSLSLHPRSFTVYSRSEKV